MPAYIKFSTQDSNSVLIEVDKDEVTSTTGVSKVGLRDATGKITAEAKAIFESAIQSIVHFNVEAFFQAMKNLPNPPTDAEIVFGIKATGEVGNFVITKVGGEANYSVKLIWKSLNGEKAE